MAKVEIISIPIGSIFVQRIGANDRDDLNDFPVLLVFDENVTGLELTNLSFTVALTNSPVDVSSHVSIVSLDGEKSVWKAVIRPPAANDFSGTGATSGVITLTVAADRVNEGNPETSKAIRFSSAFPDTDAEVPTQLFTLPNATYSGIAVSPTRILISLSPNIRFFTHDGTEQAAEQVTISSSGVLDYFNDSFIHSGFTGGFSYPRRITLEGEAIENLSGLSTSQAVIHTSIGFLQQRSASLYWLLPYGKTGSANRVEIDVELPIGYNRLAHQDDLLYQATTRSTFGLAKIIDATEIRFVKHLNIKRPSNAGNISDIAIYRDALYILVNLTPDAVYTLDIRKYRPLAKNTKTTIPVQFSTAGDRIDLKQFAPDAERFTFSVGFNKPPYLSINASNELVVGSGGTVLVKVTAINRIDSIDFEFYLVILQASAPMWREVSSLTMRAGSSYDLFQIVPDAESIEYRSGRNRLTDSHLSNGIFTVGTIGGIAAFTARKGGRRSHIEIQIDVVQRVSDINPSNPFRYRVEIQGIDVTGDLASLPTVSETLDPVLINEYRVNEASVTLRNGDKKYNNETADNFWKTNNLNPCGFQNAIKIYIEPLNSDGNWIENLLFSGLILETFEPFREKTFKLNCVDISSRLRNALIQDFGTLEKWDVLRRQSDEANFEGIYVPDRSLSPMQPETVAAWADRQELTLSRLQLQSEGPISRNLAYASTSDLRTGGGYLRENPIARFKTRHRSEDVRFLIRQLALNKAVYNIELEIPGVEVDTPFLLNRGSVPFSVEQTRVTRLPVDWVHDASNDRILILLSNPEGHVSDLLVQYDLNSDSFRTLYTFDKALVTHRIERRNATNYYILSSKPIPQDRSKPTRPRAIDAVGYGYDSAAEGSEIKIWHIGLGNPTTTLTEHVAADDARPPQLGIHYWIGFENRLYIDAFEGIVADDRGTFKWHRNNLYYRYATSSEFGVASVNTGGTTSEMINQAVGGFWDHLNFAFDINSSGTIYFVYATGDAETSTLIVKRRSSSGTISTLLSETRGVGDFNELGVDFGAFLGCYEALFHNNYLYILATLQKADFAEDHRSVINPDVNIRQLTVEKTGERNVTTATHLNPSNLTLAPGDDIPLRIDFDGSVSGATQADLTVYGGTIQSFSISSDMIDVTIRPDDPTVHKNIVIDLAEDAVDPGNEAWRIRIDLGTKRNRTKSAGMVLYRVSTNAANPTLEVIDKWDFVHQAGCNLTVHAGSVHFVESPHASAMFKPINPDL